MSEGLLEGLRRTLADTVEERATPLTEGRPPQSGTHGLWMSLLCDTLAQRIPVSPVLEQGYACLGQAVELHALFEQRLREAGLLSAVRDEAEGACIALEAYQRAAESLLARLREGRLERIALAIPAVERAHNRVAAHHEQLMTLERWEADLLALSPAGAAVRSLQGLRAMIGAWLGGALPKDEACMAVERLRIGTRDVRFKQRLHTHPRGRALGEALRVTLLHAEDALGELQVAMYNEDLPRWASAWRQVEVAMLTLVRRGDDCAALREEQPHLCGVVA